MAPYPRPSSYSPASSTCPSHSVPPDCPVPLPRIAATHPWASRSGCSFRFPVNRPKKSNETSADSLLNSLRQSEEECVYPSPNWRTLLYAWSCGALTALCSDTTHTTSKCPVSVRIGRYLVRMDTSTKLIDNESSFESINCNICTSRNLQ